MKLVSDIRFVGEGTVRRSVWIGATAVVAVGFLAVGAATADIFDQNYLIEAAITPVDSNLPVLRTSEVWETVVYRDTTRLHTVVRVFGEALHFEFEGEDYFALKRSVNGSSAGAFDPLKECLGIESLADYRAAPPLTEPCSLSVRAPMIVRADERGQLERLARTGPDEPYADFSVTFTVSPTQSEPDFDLVDRFPWIATLEPYERSLYPVKIPEEGTFVPEKHYEKDFVVQP